MKYGKITLLRHQARHTHLKTPEGAGKMAALSSDFTDHTVLIYDTYGNYLNSSFVTSHDKEARQVILEKIPEELRANENCKLIILTSPTPCEFQGKVKKMGANFFIALFQGQEKESRDAPRYPVSNPALITALIEDEQVYGIQNPIKVSLINISTTGIRFRAPYYSFEIGDMFQMDLFIGNKQKKVTAKVVNNVDSTDTSDYGCRFLLIL